MQEPGLCSTFALVLAIFWYNIEECCCIRLGNCIVTVFDLHTGKFYIKILSSHTSFKMHFSWLYFLALGSPLLAMSHDRVHKFLNPRILAAPPPASDSSTIPATVKNATFQQLIDHSNPSLGTFSQFYYYSTEFYGGSGSPIVSISQQFLVINKNGECLMSSPGPLHTRRDQCHEILHLCHHQSNLGRDRTTDQCSDHSARAPLLGLVVSIRRVDDGEYAIPNIRECYCRSQLLRTQRAAAFRFRGQEYC